MLQYKFSYNKYLINSSAISFFKSFKVLRVMFLIVSDCFTHHQATYLEKNEIEILEEKNLQYICLHMGNLILNNSENVDFSLWEAITMRLPLIAYIFTRF